MSAMKLKGLPKVKSQPAVPLVLDEADGIPPIESRLRHNILRMPSAIDKASGIVVYGRRIKSLLY